MEILHSGIDRAICSALLVLLFSGCSHPHEALWWNMMESHAEFSRVTGLVRQEQADRNFASDSVVVLSDSAIAYIERLEAALFTAADLEDTRNEQSLESVAAAYYDHRATTDILIGDETSTPRLGMNSAYALRLRIEGHKRSLEQVARMRKGELDIYLSTDRTVRSPTGNLTMWELATFYGLPFATVIERLTRMKSAVRQMEYDALTRMRSVELPDSSATGMKPYADH